MSFQSLCLAAVSNCPIEIVRIEKNASPSCSTLSKACDTSRKIAEQYLLPSIADLISFYYSVYLFDSAMLTSKTKLVLRYDFYFYIWMQFVS